MKLENQLAPDLQRLIERFASVRWIERAMLSHERCLIVFTPLGFQRINAIAALLRINMASGVSFSSLCVEHFRGFLDELSPSFFGDREFQTLLVLAEAYSEQSNLPSDSFCI